MQLGAHYLGHDRCEFTVWAPQADSVSLQILTPEERQIPLQPQSEGYWNIIADGITPGSHYLYQLNGQEAWPDPASHFQPEGVHRPSEIINHQFTWHDQSWTGIPLAELIIYELHVGTFTQEGTFEAIIARIPDLLDLGINAIELMPIAQFPGDQPTENHCAYRNWGYDGTYPFAVQNSYGGPEGLKRLVDACHQQGMVVILDVVYNHFGPEGNYFGKFGPYFTETYRTPWGNAINYDDRLSQCVRDFFLENALYWLREYHIDALRLDAIQAIYDLGAYPFLAELADRVQQFSQQQGRPYYLIAESDLNDPKVIRPQEQGGYGLDAQWSDDFHHSLHALLTGEQTGYYQDFGQCAHLAKAYRDSFVYDWKYAPHRQRFHGNSAVDRPPTQFVVCIQNHDQVGNCRMGERLARVTSFEGLKLAAGAVLLSPYIPLLFMGEEYAEKACFLYFVSHSDPDLIQAVRAGRKAEFEAFHYEGEPMDPEAVETFMKCKLNWDKRHEGEHGVIWSFYQHLIRLRRTLPALQTRDRQCLEAESQESEKLVWWRRWSEQHQLFCLMSFNHRAVTVQPSVTRQGWRKILDSADSKWQGQGALAPETLAPGQEISLQPQSFILYELTQ